MGVECSVVPPTACPGPGASLAMHDDESRAVQPLSFFSLVAGAVLAAVCF